MSHKPKFGAKVGAIKPNFGLRKKENINEETTNPVISRDVERTPIQLKIKKKNKPFGAFSKPSTSINKPSFSLKKDEDNEMKIEQESGDFFEESFSNSKKLDQTQDNSEDRRTKPIIRNSKIRESMKPNFKKIKLEASKNSIRQQDEGEKHKEKDDDDFFNDTIGEDDFQFDEPIDLKIDNNVDIAYESHKNQNRNTNTANKSKLALQRKKVRAVHKIIELKIEKYDFLDLSAASQYQAYLAKLTDGRVKNSSEQTNDEDQQVGCQTEDGGQAEYACQFPEISLPPPIVDETAQGKRLKVFLKEESDLIEEILVYSEKTTGTSKQMYELEIPYCIKKICQDPILDQSTVLQISKAQTFVLVHVQTC